MIEKIGHVLLEVATSAVLVRYDSTENQIKVPDISGSNFTWQERDFDDGPRKVVELWRDDTIPVNHKIVGETETFDGTKVVLTYDTVAKTQEELDQEEKETDTKTVADAALELAEITITLIDALLAKGTIVTSDFNVKTRQKYQDLKILVDKLR